MIIELDSMSPLEAGLMFHRDHVIWLTDTTQRGITRQIVLQCCIEITDEIVESYIQVTDSSVDYPDFPTYQRFNIIDGQEQFRCIKPSFSYTGMIFCARLYYYVTRYIEKFWELHGNYVRYHCTPGRITTFDKFILEIGNEKESKQT